MTTAIADRRDSLHVLGQDVSGASSTIEALTAQGLTGWNVRTVPTFLQDGSAVPGGRAAIADVPDRGTGERRRVTFGQVGKTYQPVQTEAFAGLLDTLGNEAGAGLDIVTTLNGGRRVMVGLKLPEPIAVGGFDKVGVSMVAMINHLTGANRLSVVPFRLFCANQQPQIISEGDDLFVLRHTTNAGQRMDDAGAMLNTAGQRLAQFEASAEAMLATPLSEGEFLSRTNKLFPQGGKGPAGLTRHENRQATLRRIFVDEPTNEPIRWTAWAGYQAVIEYVDHYQGTRQAKGENGEGAEMPTTPEQRRALRALTGASTAIKLSALAAFSPAALN